MSQPTTPNTVEDFLPLPRRTVIYPDSDDKCYSLAYTADQMRAYVLADRAQRPASAVDAADFIDKRAQEYLDGNAGTEHDTGAVVWHYGDAGRDYYNTLVELADEIRALPTSGQPVPRAGRNAQPEQPASPTVAGSVDTDEFHALLKRYREAGHAMAIIERRQALIDYINAARFVPAAPSTTPEVDKLDRISERRSEKLAAPSEIEAAVELPAEPSHPELYMAWTQSEREAIVTYATEAVLKDRASMKGNK